MKALAKDKLEKEWELEKNAYAERVVTALKSSSIQRAKRGTYYECTQLVVESLPAFETVSNLTSPTDPQPGQYRTSDETNDPATKRQSPSSLTAPSFRRLREAERQRRHRRAEIERELWNLNGVGSTKDNDDVKNRNDIEEQILLPSSSSKDSMRSVEQASSFPPWRTPDDLRERAPEEMGSSKDMHGHIVICGLEDELLISLFPLCAKTCRAKNAKIAKDFLKQCARK